MHTFNAIIAKQLTDFLVMIKATIRMLHTKAIKYAFNYLYYLHIEANHPCIPQIGFLIPIN